MFYIIYRIYNIVFIICHLMWDFRFLPSLPEIVYVCHTETVSAFRQTIIFDSYTDGSKSMSSHKISASATKLYRNIMMPDALWGKSEQLAYFWVALLSCIHLTAELLCILPSLLSYYSSAHVEQMSNRMLQQGKWYSEWWMHVFYMNTYLVTCNPCVVVMCQNQTYYHFTLTHNVRKGKT